MWFKELDEADNRILELIRDHARLTYSEIGAALGLSRGTVRNRMEEMEKMGIIQGYQTMIQPANSPEMLPFFLDLEVDPEQMNAILDRLAEDAVIRKLVLVSGNCRIHAEGLSPNRNTLQAYTNQLYRNLKGVRRMSCSFILSTLKDADGGLEYEKRAEGDNRPGGSGAV